MAVRLFCDSRADEWEQLHLDATIRGQLMHLQFEAQTASYRTGFPAARFDIVELADEPIGRIVIDRPGNMLHLVDIVLAPRYRNRGIGTAILEALIEEARAAQLPVRLAVAASNASALRLYLRLGFISIGAAAMHVELERRPRMAERSK